MHFPRKYKKHPFFQSPQPTKPNIKKKHSSIPRLDSTEQTKNSIYKIMFSFAQFLLLLLLLLKLLGLGRKEMDLLYSSFWDFSSQHPAFSVLKEKNKNIWKTKIHEKIHSRKNSIKNYCYCINSVVSEVFPVFFSSFSFLFLLLLFSISIFIFLCVCLVHFFPRKQPPKTIHKNIIKRNNNNKNDEKNNHKFSINFE